jgi:hypothetical protein
VSVPLTPARQIDDIVAAVAALGEGRLAWADVAARFPHVTCKEDRQV